MSLRPLGYQSNLSYANFFRNEARTRYTITQHLRTFSRLCDTHCTHHWSATSPHHANKPSFSLRSLFSDLLRPAHNFRGHGKWSLTQQCRHQTASAAKDPELCVHCGTKTIPKARRHVEAGNLSSGWHCKACVRNIRAHGHLPNEEQLEAISRRRLIRASGEASKISPCRHCGTMTAPRSSRKFIDTSNPSAGFHCRTCVRHFNHHGSLPTETDLAAFEYRKQMRSRRPTVTSKNNTEDATMKDPTTRSHSKSSDSKSPKQMKQSRGEYPCMHCGDKTISSSKRRLVEPQNPAAGYYCQPCTRSLLETDALPSSVKIAALRKLRETRSQSNPRVLKSPCLHCGEITAPSSKRRLVESKNPQSGYYCRACADCLIETNSLPSDIRLAVRRAREQVRLKNLQASQSKESQSPVSEGEVTPNAPTDKTEEITPGP
jgi:hypothetical protein